MPLQAEFVKGVVALGGLPSDAFPEVAFSGRSNVGKSSLLNVLCHRKGLAKVSQRPGKTRELNFFRVGNDFHLVDLPGYGFANVPQAVSEKWGKLVEDYLTSREQLAGVVQLVDIRHGPSKQDQDMLRWLAGEDRPALLVATKSDKLKRNATVQALAKLKRDWPTFDVVAFSALNRDGTKEITAWVERVAREWKAPQA